MLRIVPCPIVNLGLAVPSGWALGGAAVLSEKRPTCAAQIVTGDAVG